MASKHFSVIASGKNQEGNALSSYKVGKVSPQQSIMKWQFTQLIVPLTTIKMVELVISSL